MVLKPGVSQPMKREVFEHGRGKCCGKIYGSVYDNGLWRIRTNKELTALYQELDTVAEIKKARLRWLGHVYEQT
jgi:hypothetical protein